MTELETLLLKQLKDQSEQVENLTKHVQGLSNRVDSLQNLTMLVDHLQQQLTAVSEGLELR